MPGKFTNYAMEKLLLDAKLSAEDGYDGLFTGAKVRLLKADFDESTVQTLAETTIADFSGYADSAAITWSTPYVSSATDKWQMVGDAKQFLCNGVSSNTIYGFCIHDAAVTPVALYFEKFSAPEVVELDDGITVLPQVSFSPANQVAGSSRVVT